MAKPHTLLTALAAGLALTFAVPATAQDKGAAKKDDGAKKGAGKTTKKGGKKPVPVKAPQDRVIKVLLKNGNAIRGYALDGRLFEREVRIIASSAGTRTGFKRQEAYEPVANRKVKGAGIRIWYPNNAQGFLFVSYQQIKRVEAGRKLTRREQQRLFAAIRRKEKKIAAAAAKLREQNRMKQVATDMIRRAQIEESIAKTKGVSVEDDRKVRQALLTAFPPGEGDGQWNAKRKSEIERKLAILGKLPTAQETKFVTHFAQWAKARDEAKKIGWSPPKKTTGAKKGTGDGAKTGTGDDDKDKTPGSASK